MTRITIFGAGAIGGHLAVRLAQVPGTTVSVVARGSHLAAIRANGLALLSGGERLTSHPFATDDAAELPEQDLVFVTLKAPAIAAMAAQLARLSGSDGLLVFFTNGLPWWMEPVPAGSPLATMDRNRILGGVVYSANSVERPGVIRHASHNHWVVGEPEGGTSPRSEAVGALLTAAGFNGGVDPELRREIWHKLIYNASGNPLAALTRLDVRAMMALPPLRALLLEIRREIASVASSAGEDFTGLAALASLDDLAEAGNVKPSMLQDVLAGRPMECDAIVDAPRRIGQANGVPTPSLDVVSALLGGLDGALREG